MGSPSEVVTRGHLLRAGHDRRWQAPSLERPSLGLRFVESLFVGVGLSGENPPSFIQRMDLISPFSSLGFFFSRGPRVNLQLGG